MLCESSCSYFVRQACRYGHIQHLEHLLFYGADMHVENASGNTALHICALYKQVCTHTVLRNDPSQLHLNSQ